MYKLSGCHDLGFGKMMSVFAATRFLCVRVSKFQDNRLQRGVALQCFKDQGVGVQNLMCHVLRVGVARCQMMKRSGNRTRVDFTTRASHILFFILFLGAKLRSLDVFQLISIQFCRF